MNFPDITIFYIFSFTILFYSDVFECLWHLWHNAQTCYSFCTTSSFFTSVLKRSKVNLSELLFSKIIRFTAVQIAHCGGVLKSCGGVLSWWQTSWLTQGSGPQIYSLGIVKGLLPVTTSSLVILQFVIRLTESFVDVTEPLFPVPRFIVSRSFAKHHTSRINKRTISVIWRRKNTAILSKSKIVINFSTAFLSHLPVFIM